MQTELILANIDAMWFVFLFVFPFQVQADPHGHAKASYQAAIRKLLKEDAQKPWEAIALLEGALLQYPNDERIKGALRHARRDLKEQSLEFKCSLLFPETWTLGLHVDALRFLTVSAFALCLLCLSLFSGRARWLGSFLCLALTLPLLISLWARHHMEIGVITKDESGAYTGPGEAYSRSFSLHGGASVLILEHQAEPPMEQKETEHEQSWTKIRTLHPLGKQYRMAWVPSEVLWSAHPRVPASMQPHPRRPEQSRKPHARGRALH
jgi:hypothetical protein